MKPLAAAAPAFLALALLIGPACAASFDCAKAATEIEKMICADAELSKLDELLGDRYVRARSKAADPKALRAERSEVGSSSGLAHAGGGYRASLQHRHQT